MREITNYFYLFVLPVLLITGVSGQELEIGGAYRGEFEAVEKDSAYKHQHWINVVLRKNFGNTAEMYLDLEFNTYEIGRASSLIQEAYVNYYTQHIDWRFGKQIIAWGSSYRIKPTDYFNPYDLTIITPAEKKLGVTGAQGTYFAPNRTEISVVFTPFFDEHHIASAAQNIMIETTIKNTIQYMNTIAPSGIQVFPDPGNNLVISRVDDTIENSQGGVKFTKRGFLGMDVSLSAYHGRDKLAGVDHSKTMNSINLQTTPRDNLATIYLEYPQVTRGGVDLIGSIAGAGIWLEGVHNWYQPKYMNETNNFVFGADYRFSNDLYIVGQGLYFESRAEGEDEIKAVMIHGRKPVFGFHEIEITGLYEMESESYFIQPQFKYSLSNAISLQIGGTVIQMQNIQYAELISTIIADRIFARLSVDF